MKIFKGRYYKGLYELEKSENKLLETNLKTKEDKITEQKKVIKKLMDDTNLENNVNRHYESQIAKLEEKVERKEQLRRKVAGKVGGLTAEKHKLLERNNELLREKAEMRDLINKLLEEVRKNSKERYKPTLKELKEYFKIKY